MRRPAVVEPGAASLRATRRASFTALVASALVLAGCATPTVRRGAPAPAPARPAAVDPAPSAPPRAAPPAPAALSPLQTEQRWLDQWYRDTPVAIALADPNTLTIDVPLVHAFAPGDSNVKPALAKVLDHVATSLKRQPALRVGIGAPPDPNAGVAQGASRAQQVRSQLLARGIPAARLAGVGTVRAGAPVQLRLTVQAQAIDRLDDATLPVPALGIRPPPVKPPAGR